ncbi:MAG TPA: DUF1467 family protein [Hyphomicrobium sp.]|nr:DUF1467 family protein [Hyphomicrobium sp.]
MRPSIAIATFFCVWFITLFTVLPFFIRTQDEEGSVVPGTPESAPHKISMWKVFAVNTLVAAVAFSGVYAVVSHLNAE